MATSKPYISARNTVALGAFIIRRYLVAKAIDHPTAAQS